MPCAGSASCHKGPVPQVAVDTLRASSSDPAAQCAVIERGQMFAGPQLQAFGDVVTTWPVPVQAHVATVASGAHSAVLVVPKAVMQDAVSMIEEHQMRRIVDECCRVSTLRHLSPSQLTQLAQYCTVRAHGPRGYFLHEYSVFPSLHKHRRVNVKCAVYVSYVNWKVLLQLRIQGSATATVSDTVKDTYNIDPYPCRSKRYRRSTSCSVSSTTSRTCTSFWKVRSS